jgi:hypothetical protein
MSEAVVAERDDFLTGTMATWTFFKLRRAIVGLAALASTPLPHEPTRAADVELHNQWRLQVSDLLIETRFMRETELAMPNGETVSLRAYIQHLAARMHDASQESIFGDLEGLLKGVEDASDDSPSTESTNARDEECDWLAIEARGCVALCFAHDARVQRLVMVHPARFAPQLGPPNEQRARRFHERCIDFARDFSNGSATVHDIGAHARDAWVFGE